MPLSTSDFDFGASTFSPRNNFTSLRYMKATRAQVPVEFWSGKSFSVSDISLRGVLESRPKL